METKYNLERMGTRIRNARKLREVTMEQLADRVGLNKSTIQRYEKGLIQSPKQPVIKAIADALEVNYDWLCGLSENVEPVDGDDEITRYLTLLETRPDLRSLLKTAENVTVEQVEAVISFLSSMRGGQ